MTTQLIFSDVTKESLWSDIININLIIPDEKLILNISNDLQSFDVTTNKIKINHTNENLDICNWCRLKFDKPVGIPREIKYKEDKIIYYTIGSFCTYNCALAYSNTEKNNSYYTKSLLRTLFSNLYPNKILIESPDWRLLKHNGGTLEIEEFFDTRFVYKLDKNYSIININQNINMQKIGTYRNY